MNPRGVWWSWNIFERGPAVPSVQGVDKRGYRSSEDRLLEVVVTHKVGNEGYRFMKGDQMSMSYSAWDLGRDVRHLAS